MTRKKEKEVELVERATISREEELEAPGEEQEQIT